MSRILMIDDEESLLNSIGGFLKVKGNEVFLSPDGKAGIEMIKEKSPEILLLDLHLKDGPSGIQILKLAKMINPDIKVVIFTGFGEEEETRKTCMDLGASAFLSKPTSLKIVAETIDKISEGK